MANSDPVDSFLSRVDGVQPRGNGWIARCPAHDDRQASLKIDRGDDGRLLVKCHASCETESVLAAVGLTWADTFADGATKREPKPINRLGRFECAYDYFDGAGTLLFQAVRFTDPKGFRQRRPDGHGGWIWNLQGVPLVLYRYPELIAADTSDWVFWCEGEKDADNLARLGFVSTTNAMGAGKLRPQYIDALKGRRVVVLQDNDDAGRAHAQTIASALNAAGIQVRVPALVGLSEHGDITDWLSKGHTADELRELVETTPDWSDAPTPARPSEVEDASKPKGRKSQATQLVDLIESLDVELWHNTAGDAYASISIDGHIEQHQLGSRGFRDLACKMFFDAFQSVPGSQALQDAINVLSGKARFDGPEEQTFMRQAWRDDVLWIDLGTTDRSAVRIDADGFTVVPSQEIPVKFRRGRAMKALPLPVDGGSLDILQDMFRLGDDEWKLVKGWLCGCFQPEGARAFLELNGQQGSGKTTLLRMLIHLVDPAEVDVRSMPKDEESLVIAVTGRAVLGIDNLSSLPVDQADAFCRVSTGGGLGKRALYTDSEEIVVRVQLPMAWTGINSVITAYPDLQQRTLTVSINRLEETSYQSERSLWESFESHQAALLGCLYRAISVGIRRRKTYKPALLPRMADFAGWVEAVAPAFAWEPDEFLLALDYSQTNASVLAVDNSPIGEAILKLMCETPHWEGTGSELLEALRVRSDEERKKMRAFPKQANHLSNHLNRLRPALSNMGVWVGVGRSHKGRTIFLDRNEKLFGKEQDGQPDEALHEPDQSEMNVAIEPRVCLHDGCSNLTTPPSRYYCDFHSAKGAA